MGEWMSKLLVSILVGCLLLAGCGDGDDAGGSAGAADSGSAQSDAGSESSDPTAKTTGESSAKSISSTAFVKEANRICKATLKAVTSKTFPIMEKELGKTPEFDRKSENEREALEARLVSTVMAPALHEEVDELRALGIPAGDEGQVEAMLESFEKLAVVAETKADEVVKYGTTAMDRPTNLADQYGVERCPYG